MSDAGTWITDRDIAHAASYQSLFTRWECQPWNTAQVSLLPDVAAWEDPDRWAPGQQDFVRWMLAAFYFGEDRVAHDLTPILMAVDRDEAQFLCTQLADEARHTRFFHRYLADVIGECEAPLSSGQRELFRMLAEAALNANASHEATIRAVTIYHILVEGVLALTATRYLARAVGDRLPGLQHALRLITRDESRHVGFGVLFLRQAVQADRRRIAPLIQDTVREAMPLVGASLVPPGVTDLTDYRTPFGDPAALVAGWAGTACKRRMAAIGLGDKT